MRSILDVPAPAKLNLFLHVTGRRADGYHLLQSVFTLIDWCDTLHFERRDDGRISREDLRGALPAEDLCVRAARLLQSATGCSAGVRITLDKRIPAQAGLGGGSSDAATTLLALNRLWRLDLARSQLAALALRLGADLPFFLDGGGSAWVEGVGERVRRIELPAASFIVIKPDVGVATAEIFAADALARDHALVTIAGFRGTPFDFGCNDLQPVAERLCPQVQGAVALFSRHGLKGRMTGSGSAVFAQVAPDGAAAAEIERTLPPGWIARTCANLQAHPLAGWAGSDG